MIFKWTQNEKKSILQGVACNETSYLGAMPYSIKKKSQNIKNSRIKNGQNVKDPWSFTYDTLKTEQSVQTLECEHSALIRLL